MIKTINNKVEVNGDIAEIMLEVVMGIRAIKKKSDTDTVVWEKLYRIVAKELLK